MHEGHAPACASSRAEGMPSNTVATSPEACKLWTHTFLNRISSCVRTNMNNNDAERVAIKKQNGHDYLKVSLVGARGAY